jgi:hypothetical protein
MRVLVPWTPLLALTLAVSLGQLPRIAAEEAHTLKERLSDKASDDQRVDNCHVPMERRGPKPRPDCPEEPQSPSPAAEGPVAPNPR